jgi:hypothetical protein
VLDAGTVYSNVPERLQKLRAYQGGLMKTLPVFQDLGLMVKICCFYCQTLLNFLLLNYNITSRICCLWASRSLTKDALGRYQGPRKGYIR